MDLQEIKFTSSDTKILKGIAVLLMLVNHVWMYVDKTALGSYSAGLAAISGAPFLHIGSFGKMCVSMFMFWGGYGTYLSSRGKSFDLVGKLKRLYGAYWKVFFLFVPIAFLFFSNQPAYCADAEVYARFSQFSPSKILSDLFGLTTNVNMEWWFLRSYVVAILCFPLCRRIIDRFSAAVSILIFVVLEYAMQYLFPALGGVKLAGASMGESYFYRLFFCQVMPFTACFWMGAVFAAHDLPGLLNRQLKAQNLTGPLASLAIMGGVFILRQFYVGQTMEWIMVPVFSVACLNLLQYMQRTRKLLSCLGRQSTNIWLTHSFFCFYFYPTSRLVTITGMPILSLVSLAALSYFAGCLIDRFWQLPSRLLLHVQKKNAPL